MLLVGIDNDSEPHPYMRTAEIESDKSEERFKIGAVLLKGNRVLTKSFNQNKTSRNYGSGLFSNLHAEGAVIAKAKSLRIDTNETTLVLYRKGHQNCKPCKDCQRLIKEAGIKKVYYTYAN